MKRTIDISLQGSDTNVTLSQDFTTQRMVMVSLSKAGFTSNSDGSNRSITVSFGTLQTEVRWGDIANKPNGKLFGGVITPNSAIPTTNADVYYMAYEAGFYTNFGFTLAEGTMAFVYRFGNGWIRTTVSMDTVGFVQGERENQTYFNNNEMDELRKSVAFYYGREGFFMKTAEDDEVMTFTLVATSINVDNNDNTVWFYRRGGCMFVNQVPEESGNDYLHWFEGEGAQFYLKDAMDQMATYFEENKQDTLTFDSTPTINSTNPVTSGGVADAIANFITVSVNDLVNYYTKNETYTKTEVANLIAAINQFHYEIAASTSAVSNPQSNVLYLIGPIGSGTDRYEEYVYPDSTTGWVKIGDTSIDLSGYVTTAALNTALANYTTTADLTTILLGKQDNLVSGTNIKTINGESILGSGNLVIESESYAFVEGHTAIFTTTKATVSEHTLIIQ